MPASERPSQRPDARERVLAFDEPPAMRDPSGMMAVWFTEPPGAVLQMTRSAYGSHELGSWIARQAYDALVERFPGDTKLVLIFDVSAMVDRDPRARAAVQSAARRLASRIERALFIAPIRASELYKRSIEVALTLLRVFGVKVETAPSLAYALGVTGQKPIEKR